jgi:glycosyltransferase involved in cell wall biosynthesis
MSTESDSTGKKRSQTPAVSEVDPESTAPEGQVTAAASASDLIVSQEAETSPELSIVMPTLNEEEGIRECLNRAKRAVEELGITTEIIVSDSSSDRTPEIAKQHGAIVVQPTESGYGNAYKHGFEHARGDYVAIGDADTTYDFEELPKLLQCAEQEEADLVLGSRLNGEIKPGAMPALHQYIGNPLLTRFLNTFYDAGVSDAHSGFRVIRREALDELDLQTGGMEFASEMIMEAASQDMVIEEVPITYHEREGEATLESFRDGWRHVKFMLINAPGYLFSVPAVWFTLLGTVTMGLSLAEVTLGGLTFGIQTMIGGMLLTIVGYQVGSLALFSSVAANPIRDPQDPFTQRFRDSFRLEHGASAGVLMSGGGLLVLLYGVTQWVMQGFAGVPAATWNLAAATLVVLGLQTVFSSFFLSLLSESRSA